MTPTSGMRATQRPLTADGCGLLGPIRSWRRQSARRWPTGRPAAASTSPPARAGTRCGWPRRAGTSRPSTSPPSASSAPGRALRAAGVTVTTTVADVTVWSPERPVDLVLCAFLHLPSPTMRPLLTRLGGWVAPGGLLVLLGHDAANIASGVGGPQDPDVLWDTDLLRATSEAAGLVVHRAEQVRRPVADEPRPAIDVLLGRRATLTAAVARACRSTRGLTPPADQPGVATASPTPTAPPARWRRPPRRPCP